MNIAKALDYFEIIILLLDGEFEKRKVPRMDHDGVLQQALEAAESGAALLRSSWERE